MAESFFHRYHDELVAIRHRAARFADAFPKIAGRLRMTGDVADDPHVERLIQSFAYSAARIRQKLDDEFPELTDGLLETLYPHYLAPIPSMSIVRFTPGKTLAGVQTVPRHTEILTEPISGEPCRFRTTQDVEIAPIEIVSVTLSGQPISAPPTPFSGTAGCLRISLAPRDPRNQLPQMGLKRLRFHLASQWRQASALYELLANHTIGVAIARHPDDKAAMFLPRENLRPIGFEEAQSMLPCPPSGFVGYRLLTDFFALPQKFLFIDITGLERWQDDKLEIFVYLNETDRKLEPSVNKHDLVLHATPVVNLFQQSCEPVLLDGTRTEYRLLPDSRRQNTREIYSVERILLTSQDGEEAICHPFFRRSVRGDAATVFWQIQRRFDADDKTSDIDIAFVDTAHRAARQLDAVASVDALCLNRNLPEKLPFGGGHPHLQLSSGHDAVANIEPLIPPTPSVRMDHHEGRSWRLMSHLLLNHLSLFDNEGAALKDILSLYIFRDTPETKQIVDAIVHVEAHTSTARLGTGGIVPGTEIHLEFDPAAIDRASAYLFGSVLDHFFSLYTSVNSFTRLTVALKGQSTPVATWPARAAQRALL